MRFVASKKSPGRDFLGYHLVGLGGHRVRYYREKGHIWLDIGH